MYACQLAAEVTRGKYGEPGTVVFASGEDSFEDTLKPRLQAAGADLSRIVFLDAVVGEGEDEIATGSFHLPKDAQLLADALEEAQPTLLIVDPLSAHVSAGVDSWKDESVRLFMTPLTVLAEEHGCSVVITHHTNKRVGADALVRVGGSLGGIVGPARAVFFWGIDEADADYRVLYHAKHTNSAKQPLHRFSASTRRP